MAKKAKKSGSKATAGGDSETARAGGGTARKASKAGGSKIPRELRVAMDKIGELAKEPLAREIVLAAAGAALAARKDARKTAKKAARATGDAIGDSPTTAAWLGAAITAAAVEAGRRLLEAYDKSEAGASSRGTPANGGAAKLRSPAKPGGSSSTGG